MTIVCGDSHTATHGAFGALAFGIGTSEVEHVLATQTLQQRRPSTMRVRFDGTLAPGVTAKDLVLAAIGQIGVDGGVGHVIEYAGPAIERSVDGGAHDGLQHVDRGRRARRDDRPRRNDVRVPRGRPGAPQAPPGSRRSTAGASSRPIADAAFDREVVIDVGPRSAPQVTWGTNPGMVVPIDGNVPDPASIDDPTEREARRACARLHGARAGDADPRRSRSTASSSARARTRGSRTCAPPPRSSRAVTSRPSVRAMVVPGSAKVKTQAEKEGLDRIFTAAGFEWREAGCSMCLGMNPDVLAPGERCASTSNRNFEGRQGAGGRTHLVSPAMAAAATAIAGRFATVPGMRAFRHVTVAGGRARSPRRRHRPDHPEAVPEADRAHRATASSSSSTGEGPRVRAAPARGAGARSSSPAGTSGAARRASTPPGRSRTPASGS